MNNKTISFGSFLRNKRKEKHIGLREICKKLRYDPGNYCKIENDNMPIPNDDTLMKDMARILGIAKSSQEYIQFNDLADISRGKIPSDLLKNRDMAILMPAFFRTCRNEKPTRGELIKIIEDIKKL